MSQNLIAGVICLVWLAGPASPGAAAPPPTDGGPSTRPSAGVEAITRPSQDVTLSFVRPGTIAKILVKDGQTVAAGELLVQQDDAAERAQLAQLEAQAGDETRIKAAEAQLAQKHVDYKRMKEMSSGGAATETELEHARLEETIAELSLALAKFQRDQDGRKRDEVKIQLDRMRLTSPTAGRVERVYVEAGESVDALKEVVRIVQIDPLWVDAPVPLATARTLKVGGSAQVAFGEGAPATAGRIIHIASIADAASGTLAVRVELANPAGRPAGEIVRLSFPPVVATENSPLRKEGVGVTPDVTARNQPPAPAGGYSHSSSAPEKNSPLRKEGVGATGATFGNNMGATAAPFAPRMSRLRVARTSAVCLSVGRGGVIRGMIDLIPPTSFAALRLWVPTGSPSAGGYSTSEP